MIRDNLKRYGLIVSVSLMCLMLVTSVPLGYVGVSDTGVKATNTDGVNAVSDGVSDGVNTGVTNDVTNGVTNDVSNTVDERREEIKDHLIEQGYSPQEAEALLPAIPAAGYLAAGAVGIGGAGFGVGYAASEYFSDGKEAQDKQIKRVVEDNEETANNATDEQLRTATHTSAIIASGTSEAYYDRVSNDLTTVEGQVDQIVSRDLIKKGDNITSEAEAIEVAESGASEYLGTRLPNHIETHNLHALSVKQFTDQLDTANYSSDYGAVDVVEVDDTSDLPVSNSGIIKLTDDIDLTNVSTSAYAAISLTDDSIVDLNGYEIYGDASGVSDIILANDGVSNVKIKDGEINVSNSGYIYYGGTTVANLDLVNVGITGDNTLGIGNGNIYYNLNNSNINIGQDASFSSESVTTDVLSKDPVTFNTTEIANANSNFESASDVPKATFEHNNETVSLPAINISVSESYLDKGYVLAASPYNSNTGEPIYSNGQNVVIMTSTSGTSDYAIPQDGVRSYNTILEADSISDSTYQQVGSFASDVWNNYLQDIANDPDKSIYDNETITKELGQLQDSRGSLDSPKDVRSVYTGLYDSVINPMSDTIKVEEVNGDKSVTGIVFTENMSKVLEGPDPDKIEKGDIINGTGDTLVFMVEDGTGKRVDLNAKYEVVNIVGKESLGVRDYELDKTNLAETAKKLEDQKEGVEVTFPEPTGGGGSDSVPTYVWIIAGLVAVALLGQQGNKKRRN